MKEKEKFWFKSVWYSFLEESGTEVGSLESHEEQMVVCGGVEKSKVVQFSTLQSQVNGNILDFLLFSHEFTATAWF